MQITMVNEYMEYVHQQVFEIKIFINRHDTDREDRIDINMIDVSVKKKYDT